MNTEDFQTKVQHGALFFIVSVLLLVLGFTGILWFGLCYFLSAISLLIGILFSFEDNIFPSGHNPRNSFPLIIIGIPLIIIAVLPFSMYEMPWGNSIIPLDVEYMPAIITIEVLIIGIIGLIIIINGICGVLFNDKKANILLEISKINEKQYKAEENNFRRKVINKNATRISQLKKEYGLLTKEIKIEAHSNEFENKILLFESSGVIVIQNKTYKFSDIIKYEVVDKSIESRKVTTSTKTSTGNTIGRAVVGGVIGGGVGAIIGGATAKKNTTSEESVNIVHNYEVRVTINSLSNPQIIIRIGNNEIKTKEIATIFEVLIGRNKVSNITN